MADLQKKEINIVLEGISDIMFDRFYDHSKEDIPPERKLYLNGASQVVLPSENIWSFLFREMPPNGIIRRIEGKKAKDYIDIGQAMLAIKPSVIPFLRDGEPIVFDGFGDSKPFYYNDWSAGIGKQSGGKAIKLEIRKRPVLREPWDLAFKILLFPNDRVTPEKLRSWFEQGGLVVALGTYRPKHGRFSVRDWDVL
jgi:hypothetical protein